MRLGEVSGNAGESEGWFELPRRAVVEAARGCELGLGRQRPQIEGAPLMEFEAKGALRLVEYRGERR